MTESCCIMHVLHIYDLHSFCFSRQQLFVFIFGRILHWNIRYSAEYWKPIFGTALMFTYLSQWHLHQDAGTELGQMTRCWAHAACSAQMCQSDNEENTSRHQLSPQTTTRHFSSHLSGQPGSAGCLLEFQPLDISVKRTMFWHCWLGISKSICPV